MTLRRATEVDALVATALAPQSDGEVSGSAA
jgi:hypothetical protein